MLVKSIFSFPRCVFKSLSFLRFVRNCSVMDKCQNTDIRQSNLPFHIYFLRNKMLLVSKFKISRDVVLQRVNGDRESSRRNVTKRDYYTVYVFTRRSFVDSVSPSKELFVILKPILILISHWV